MAVKCQCSDRSKVLKMKTFAILLVVLIAYHAQSACLSKSFTSLKMRVCDKKCIIQFVDKCVSPKTVPISTEKITVKGNVTKFRRGSFENLPNFTTLSIENNNLADLMPNCFINLPSFEILLAGKNQIEDIAHGVFTGTTLTTLGLAGNKISYIEDGAFAAMPNLTILNLSNNKLSQLSEKWFDSSNITTLVLRKNEVSGLPSHFFETFPKLVYLDLAFNKIRHLQDNAFIGIKHLQTLDLTHNNIWLVNVPSFPIGARIDQLHIAMNRLSYLDGRVLDRIQVKTVYMHPNPWSCPCMEEIMKWAQKNKVDLINPHNDVEFKWNDHIPVCLVPERRPNICDEFFTDYNNKTLIEPIYFKIVNYDSMVV